MKVKKLGSLALLVAASLMVGMPASAAEGMAATLSGYTIRFEPRSHDGSLPWDYSPHSLIEITRSRGVEKDLILAEYSALEPGCGKVPAVATIAGRYVVICGNLGGRHYTYRIFRVGSSGLEGATLDAFDDARELVEGRAQRIAVLVTRRDQLQGYFVGPVYFPYVYALHADDSSFGFVPYFGEEAKEKYLRNYAEVRSGNDFDGRSQVMLASLMATQDRSLICGELKRWKAEGFEGARGRAADDLARKWIVKLAEIGYPSFDIRRCK